MNKKLKNILISIAKKYQTKNDPSHDFQHILRVLNLAEKITKKEKADLDIVTPAALFHDIIVYPKNSKESNNAAGESAEFAEKVLRKVPEYPKEKTDKVKICIEQCSFSKGIIPDFLEAKILQDADSLEATGAISIMRTFSSGGQMNRPFYDPRDPFCKEGTVAFRSGLDLFYRRLLLVGDKMYTSTAKRIAKRRSKFLHAFLEELKVELHESRII